MLVLRLQENSWENALRQFGLNKTMKIRPSLWAAAILALGITILGVYFGTKANNQPSETSAQVSQSEPAVSKTVIIPGQPAVPKQPGVVSGDPARGERERILQENGFGIGPGHKVSVQYQSRTNNNNAVSEKTN